MIQPGFFIPDKVNNIIFDHYPENSIAFTYYYTHCIKVTELAIKIIEKNRHLKIDKAFVIIGAMLHDIGIIKTDAPEIGCFGKYPYIAHTYLGREMLEKEGLLDIAPVCERHIGVGLTREDIISANFPLPHRDMIPITIEEKLICYADKFYSKTDKHLTTPRSPDKIRKKILKYGEDKIQKFEELVNIFGIDFINGQV
jgi:uncharacterized protein